MRLDELYTRPAFNLISLAATPLPQTGKGLFDYARVHDDDERPELQAFAFYFLDHCVALIRAKYPTGELPMELGQIVKLYHGLTTRFGMSMFAYLLIICHREARYCKSSNDDIKKTLGNTPASNFFCDIKGHGSSDVFRMLTEYKGEASLGAYTEAMMDAYYKLSWSSNYGGKKWGDIAKVLDNYVKGHISLMTLLDQSFSLQHNTAAIFNKGVIYRKESKHMAMLLDMQHAGQIINQAYDMFFAGHDALNISGAASGKYSTLLPELKKVYVQMQIFMDGTLGDHVDYEAIIQSNPKCSGTVISQYMKDAYSVIGIYETKAKQAAVPVKEENKKYFKISEIEKYEIIERKK